MRIKVCGIQNEIEVHNAIAAGADAIGFQVGQLYAGKNFILPSTAARLVEEMPPFVDAVAVTHETDAETVYSLLEKSGLSSVQLFAPPVQEVAKLRDALPRHAKIMIVEYARCPVVDFDLSEYYSLIDSVNLDCYNQNPPSIPDPVIKQYYWETAKAYIEEAPVPVVISGGLTPENVADAVTKIRPFAIDVYSGVRNAAMELDVDKLAKFIAEARKAEFALI